MTVNLITTFLYCVGHLSMYMYFSHLDLLVNYRNMSTYREAGNSRRTTTTTTTGPGQLAMSGPVIRFALVVTSLLGKLAISSWPSSSSPPPLSSPLIVSDRFSSRSPRSYSKLLLVDRTIRRSACMRKKRCDRGARRGAAGWLDESFG